MSTFNKIYINILQDNDFRHVFNFNSLSEIDENIIDDLSAKNTTIQQINWLYNAFLENYGQIGISDNVVYTLDFDLNLRKLNNPFQDLPLLLIKEKFTPLEYKKNITLGKSIEHYNSFKKYILWCKENNITIDNEFLLFL